MSGPREGKRRGQPRLETTIPIHFNLNPDYHQVPTIRKLGVGGTVCNISFEGLLIVSHLDLLDLCQIFPEALENDSAFELELFLTGPRETRELIRGAVRWYSVSELDGDTRHFRAGLHLKDVESLTIARRFVEDAMARKRQEEAFP